MPKLLKMALLHQNRHVPHWSADTPSGIFFMQIAQGNVGVRGLGLSSMSEERIKIKGQEVVIVYGFWSKFWIEIFFFDFSDGPVEERCFYNGEVFSLCFFIQFK